MSFVALFLALFSALSFGQKNLARRVGARANDRGDILRSRGGPNNANGMRWTPFSGSANRQTALVELLQETGAGD